MQNTFLFLFASLIQAHLLTVTQQKNDPFFSTKEQKPIKYY